MSSYSPYAIDESELPKWLPGEHLAAAAFLGMSLYLAVENNIAIYKIFTQRRGLYFWSLEIGSWAVLLDAFGVIFKFIAPKPRIWPLYTLCLTIGWSTFSTAQLFVLYSRLHLVLRNPRVLRYVFIMACASIPLIDVPICIVAWPAWNPYNHALSARWSPADAITERFSQIAFTICETTISTLYIRSLLQLLRSKATVRQRRVMWDLVYVMIICISVDLLTIVLIYVNQTDIQHAVQNFNYMLKFRLEFVVLNQLMSVAARGIRRETMAEKRYHHKSIEEAPCGNRFTKPSAQRSGKHVIASRDDPMTKSTQISLPQAALSKSSLSNHRATNRREQDEVSAPRSGDEKVDGAFDHIASNAVPGEGSADSPTIADFKQGISTDTVPRSETGTSSDRTHLLDRHPGGAKPRHLGTLRTRLHQRNDEDENDDDDDEFGLHMWEKNGSVILDVPWFKSKVGV